jgi:hypothetical protein
MKKAQLSTDFVITLSIILLIFIGIAFTVSLRHEQMLFVARRTYAEDIVEKLALNINSVYLAGDGTAKQVVLPLSLRDDGNYHIDVYPSEHLLEVTFWFDQQRRHYSYPIITANVTGTLTGINSTVNLTNIDGGITIE